MPRRVTTVSLAGAHKRREAPRSKNGCGTCRDRRVKCGEERPRCIRCQKASIDCKGWRQIVPTQATIIDGLEIQQYAVPSKLPGSARDRQVIHYMAVYGINSMTSFAYSGYLTSMLVRCRDETTLRNAFIALGQSHLDYCRSESAGPWQPSYDSIKAYGCALTSSRRLLNSEQPNVSTVLACCMLLYLTGRMHNDAFAGVHMDASLQLLKLWGTQSIEKRVKDGTMTVQYREFFNKVLGYASCSRLAGEAHPGFTHPAIQTGKHDALAYINQNLPEFKDPPEFSTVDQITDHFMAVSHLGLTFLRAFINTYGPTERSQISAKVISAQKQLLRLLQEWRLAVDAWEWRTPLAELDAQSQIEVLVVMSYHWIAKAWMVDALWDGEPATDPWARKPYTLLRYGRSILELRQRRRREEALPDSFKRGWRADWSITGCLDLLAQKSSNPEIVQEATNLSAQLVTAG